MGAQGRGGAEGAFEEMVRLGRAVEFVTGGFSAAEGHVPDALTGSGHNGLVPVGMIALHHDGCVGGDPSLDEMREGGGIADGRLVHPVGGDHDLARKIAAGGIEQPEDFDDGGQARFHVRAAASADGARIARGRGVRARRCDPGARPAGSAVRAGFLSAGRGRRDAADRATPVPPPRPMRAAFPRRPAPPSARVRSGWGRSPASRCPLRRAPCGWNSASPALVIPPPDTAAS